MGRFATILLAVSGTVALQVVAQAVLITSVRFIDRHMRGATELRRTFWISLGAVIPLFFGHFAQVGLWAGFLVWLGALQIYRCLLLLARHVRDIGLRRHRAGAGLPHLWRAGGHLRFADARLVDRTDLRRHQPRACQTRGPTGLRRHGRCGGSGLISL